VSGGERYFLQHDALEPFPIADEALEVCYSEHFIEHFELDKGIAWLAEMRRVLRPGGFVRVITPDLRKYAEGYFDPARAFYAEHGAAIGNPRAFPDPAELERRAFMFNQNFYLWGHRWIYDFEELRHAAAEAGFDPAAVERRAFRESLVPEVGALDLDWRRAESLYVEIAKT
jgi:predicted SAM-dependent methyltransferase